MITCPQEHAKSVQMDLRELGIKHSRADGPQAQSADIVAAILIAVPTAAVTITTQKIIESVWPKNKEKFEIYINSEKIDPEELE